VPLLIDPEIGHLARIRVGFAALAAAAFHLQAATDFFSSGNHFSRKAGDPAKSFFFEDWIRMAGQAEVFGNSCIGPFC